MSDIPFDPSQADPTAGAPSQAAGQVGGQAAGQPSEEEVRQYLSQMRGAPAEQVLAEVLQGLLNAAQIKLGRRDGRMLLDTADAVVERTRDHLSADLTGQVDQALTQLKMAQVEAEKEVAEAGQEEPNDIPADGGPPPAAQPDGPEGGAAPGQDAAQGRPTPGGTSPGQAGQGGRPRGESPLNKLWIPGR